MKILIIGPHGGGYIFLPNPLNYLQIKRPKHGIEKPEIFSTLFLPYYLFFGYCGY